MCQKSLGDMELDLLGYVKAKGEFDAMDKFRKGDYERNLKQIEHLKKQGRLK